MDNSDDIDDFDCYPIVDFDSDDEKRNESSEDETDVILHGTPQQKRRLYRRSLGHDSSSEDEFEKEMEAELNQTMLSLQNRLSQHPGQTVPQGSSSGGGEEKKCYAQDYFDSSSDEDMTSAEKARQKHAVMSNDELLYDPDMDDDDQRWVDAQRGRCQPRSNGGGGVAVATGRADRKRKSAPGKLPNSDAVLNCPACMVLLCRDCQRHSMYKSQYRAMFVTNCTVDMSETLKYPLKENKRAKREAKKRKQTALENTWPGTSESEDSAKAGSSSAGASGSDVAMETANQNKEFEAYHPVKCTECTTTVGVIDEDGIVHFFNVLASF